MASPSRPLPLRIPFLVLSLLTLPAFLGLGWNGLPPTGVSSGTLPIRSRQPDHAKRQTIAEQSIPYQEYEWGGEGDGTDVCKRWSHQSALVNGTLYVFGGQATTSAGQESHNWNRNFIQLDLMKNFDTGTPPWKSLEHPSELPPVANGYLWHDLHSIFLYGGIVPDTPHVLPPPASLWRYDIAGKKWSEITEDDFKVSSDSNQKKIERAGEGAGCNVIRQDGKEVTARGYYFGGHLDGYTTEGWSQNVERVYLKSMVEYDMGSNTFRNVSEGSGLDKAGVPERADGVLVYVPLGKKGVLIGIGGGRSETFTQLNVVDVYDIATSTWYRQATDGPTPKYRVNACAVVASAPDFSSHNVWFYGGQNLQPYKEQTQYDDLWVLTVPSFTWVEVKGEDAFRPPARAGHTCNVVNGQMVSVGGFVGKELSCDSPGVYVLDLAKGTWETDYKAPTGDNADTKVQGQAIIDGPVAGVPKVVQKIIGGNEDGGATVTRPIRTSDPDSPVATGNPLYTVTVTDANGHVSTVTSTNPRGTVTRGAGGVPGTDESGGSGSGGPNVGAIVGGVLGGLVLAILAAGFILYRIYKRKLAAIRAEREAEQGPFSDKNRISADGTTAIRPGMNMNQQGSRDDLLGDEVGFWGVLLAPRRSLRVVNS
ncbi:hypothetical protein BJ508DRAFT_414672 [Ascobolus immersus RN42]|uniref:Galactose oxidase n=1 Tax=Ascobolus immersus RN42 TaxID=1160509 RepID=A0A3N4IIY6_ASCIM|nr:hypothetical protein BJ508DRAFT_414672 [Ascobolus immersus RN42]